MLPVQPLSGLTCAVTVRLLSWQARHICPFELSRTRNFCAMTSIPCACGLWQLVHSMLPFTSFTAPVGSAVVPEDARDAARSGASLMGSSKLNGCEPLRLVVSTSMLFIVPETGTLP